ncbi:helix-turn-helix domain-containing protein [Actinophytocola sp.]|uniref:TetR/AcrR family transcriptional regulator n=1 Tax=Actinophytocola sp. TaxID=1872138 RepID=UPI002D3E071F|nr:helix-turn-helix domain-containing protein [Actinophytocola sp.]HYQ61733.1 helix-turn-helix domain-containing protein [Actinophytocola sp.]
MLSTRAQILAAARRLFVQQGYQHTSIREIAEQLGMTKTAVLYHFPAKADILAAVAEPFLDDMAASLAAVTSREEVFEAVVDVFLRHRSLLRENVMHDLALLTQAPTVHRFTELMFEANRLAAGPAPTLRDRVRAAQAIAALSDPVVAYADEPVDELRKEVLRGVARLYAED